MNTADPVIRHVAETIDDPARRAELFNAFPSLVWCSDARGQCSFVNQAWEDYTGRSVEMELGTRWLESVHDEDRLPLEREWAQALGLRRPLHVQYRLRRADGSFGWIQQSAVAVNDSLGRLTGYLGTCTDITEQRAAELMALAREHQIRMLADNVPALIAYFDARDLKCLFANKAYARMWGWDEHTIVGHRVDEVIGPEGYRIIGPHIERCRRGETVVYERNIQAADGSQRILEVSLLPQRDDSGETVSAVVLVNDITRHRMAEQEARDSEERLRKFAEATQAGIVFHDEGVITDCNDAICRLSGYSHDELVGSRTI